MSARRGRGFARGAKSPAKPATRPNESDDETVENEDQEEKITPDLESDAESSNEDQEDDDKSEKTSTGAKVIEKPKDISFDCSMCFFTTDSDINFVKHIEELHRRDMGFWCKSCGSAYESSSQLVEHIREFCDKVKHYQHACGFSTCTFKTHDPANLIFHFRNEHKGKYLFPCGQCEQQFTILTSLVLHQQQKCSNKQKCILTATSDPPRTQDDNAKRERDIVASGGKRFRCALCTFETTQKNMFVEHHTDLHMRDLCCCKRCGKVFKNPDHLADHIDDDLCCMNQYDHPCGSDDCPFTSHDPLAFRNHIRNGHPRTSLHKCDGCKKQFTIIPLLLMHIQEECPELNVNDRRENYSSNGNQNNDDTIHPFAEQPVQQQQQTAPVHYARRGPTGRRGTGARRGRGRAAAATASATTVRSRKRGRTKRSESSGEEDSDVDDPEAVITPSRSSTRVAAKKVSYTHSSDDDF